MLYTETKEHELYNRPFIETSINKCITFPPTDMYEQLILEKMS